MTLAEHPAHGPVPAPPDFPVVWETPDDEKLFWTNDRMHWPDPLPMLLTSLDFEGGINRAAAPLRRADPLLRPPHQHLPVLGLRAGDRAARGDGGAGQARRGEGRRRAGPPRRPLGERVAARDQVAHRLLARLRPARRARARRCSPTSTRPAGASTRLTEIHFVIGFPMLMGMSVFDELYRDLFGNETAFDAFKLIQGFPNKTVESGRALWALSRRALAIPAVRQVLEARAADEVIPALEATAEGREFLGELRAYLDEYGRRGDKFDLLGSPSWIERPTSVIKNLKDAPGPGRGAAGRRPRRPSSARGGSTCSRAFDALDLLLLAGQLRASRLLATLAGLRDWSSARAGQGRLAGASLRLGVGLPFGAVLHPLVGRDMRRRRAQDSPRSRNPRHRLSCGRAIPRLPGYFSAHGRYPVPVCGARRGHSLPSWRACTC